MKRYYVFAIFLAVVKGSSDNDNFYAEALGETKFKLLERNIAIHDKDSSEEKSKTFHPNPTDRDQIRLWEGGDVPFMFSHWYKGVAETEEDFSNKEKEVIRKALKHISDNVPCIRFSEVTKSAAGDKLIFSTHGDDNFYPHDSCWAYLGLVGSVGGQTTAAAGQTVHIHDDCFSFQTVVRLVLISLGVTVQKEVKEIGRKKTEGSPAQLLALARLYEKNISTGSCFKKGKIPQYFELLLQETEELKKSCHKGSYYLFLSDQHILELPSLTKAVCNIEPYPITKSYGLAGAVSAIVDGKLHVCGGGPREGVDSCHALHGSAWHGTPNLATPRHNAGSSAWQGGWLVTGGADMNTRHPTSELYTGGAWTTGPAMEEKTFFSREPLMGVEGHCQVTAGGRVIVAGGRTLPNAVSTGATFSWDGSTWSQLASMKTIRVHHACVEKDGLLYAMGGENRFDRKLKSVEMLNLATGVWSDGPDLPYDVDYVQAVNIHGDIYVVGGEGSGGKIVKLVDNTWEPVSDYGFDGQGLFSNPPIVSSEQVICF